MQKATGSLRLMMAARMSLSTSPPFQQSGLPELREGQMVEFQIEAGKGGKTAATRLKLR
jgi:hypothetical protein